MNYLEKNIHRKEWITLLRRNNTSYTVTVTFKKDVSASHSQTTVKSLLKRIRKDYFGRNIKRQFLSGYLVIEHQKSGRPHYHILIQDHQILKRQDRDFKTVVIKHCHRLNLIDETKGVDIQRYFPHSLEIYVTKAIKEENNFDFIKPLTYYGF
jgi:hypothetical protein